MVHGNNGGDNGKRSIPKLLSGVLIGVPDWTMEKEHINGGLPQSLWRIVIIGRRFFTSAVDEPYGGSSGSGGEYPPGKR